MMMPRRRAGLHCEILDDELVVVDPRDGRVFRFNASARFVWEHCEAALTTREVARRLALSGAVDPERALDHVEEMVLLLAERALLEALE